MYKITNYKMTNKGLFSCLPGGEASFNFLLKLV